MDSTATVYQDFPVFAVSKVNFSTSMGSTRTQGRYLYQKFIIKSLQCKLHTPFIGHYPIDTLRKNIWEILRYASQISFCVFIRFKVFERRHDTCKPFANTIKAYPIKFQKRIFRIGSVWFLPLPKWGCLWKSRKWILLYMSGISRGQLWDSDKSKWSTDG